VTKITEPPSTAKVEISILSLRVPIHRRTQARLLILNRDQIDSAIQQLERLAQKPSRRKFHAHYRAAACIARELRAKVGATGTGEHLSRQELTDVCERAMRAYDRGEDGR
jgi:hypothetical protein